MNLKRVTRLIELIGMLQSGHGQNANCLASACGVTRRSIFRDLESLRAAGVPVQYDEGLGEYRIPGSYYLPPTNFTAEEALAVMVLCHELGDESKMPFLSAARSAALKLESCLPARLRDHLRQFTGAISVKLQPATPRPGESDVYNELLDAVGRRRCVRITYDSLTERDEISTKLSPYRLLFSRHSWYCVGRSSLHRATRTFNLRRIDRIELLKEKYTIPRNFSLQKYLRNAWHLIPEKGTSQKVHIHFSKMVAQNVAEVAWHKTQRTELNKDGSLDYHVTVSGLNEISWWVLGYGPQAEVISPPELRKMIAERAKQMVARYNEDA